MARPDASGRLSLRYLLRALGWSPGDQVEYTVIDDAIVVTRSPTGKAAIGARGDLMIPAAARALAGLDPDSQVVLVAAPAHGALVLHAEQAVAELIAAHYGGLDGVDDG
jgi:bifunctional DNA-binding transcriptional regulator/antitoxin component of YhaV-PrlF toxin-antitoxin module